MKRIFSVFLVITTLFASACAPGPEKTPETTGQASPQNDPSPAPAAYIDVFSEAPRELTDVEVVFRIRTSFVTNETSWLDFEIVNLTANEYTYGEDFMLFKFEDDDWNYVDTLESAGWNDISLILAPFSINNGSIDLGYYFEELEAGLYRIEKDIFRNGGWCYVSAEFTVFEEEK